MDGVLLVDDHSSDDTVALAREMGLTTFVHESNLGYGRNQKTCYREALRRGADIVVMLHPDYQYSPKLVADGPWRAHRLRGIRRGFGISDLGRRALSGGMPLYKYVSNRFLTLCKIRPLISSLEYHSGYRAFAGEVLRTLPLEENSDDFVFDNEILAQAIYMRYRIGENIVPCTILS